MVSWVLKMMGGLISAGREYKPENLAFMGTDLYNKLAGLSINMRDVGLQPQRTGRPSLGGVSPEAQGTRGPMGEFDLSKPETTRGAAVVRALYNAGFRGEELTRMAAISYHESSWDPTRSNTKGRDNSHGLFQINIKPWLDKGQTPPWTIEELKDPYRSAEIARQYYIDRGYEPWTTRNMSLEPGRRAREAAGVGDYEALMTLPAPMASVGSNNGSRVVFQNTFNIQGGGNGGGGVDVRRTATLIADHLEDEMNRRMARRN
jgi:Lysozyme like domain